MTTFASLTRDVIVVKIGGGKGVNMARCVADVAQLAQTHAVVIVHGVSDALNRLCEARGVPVRTITSPNGHTSRYTDTLTRDLFVEAAQSVSAQLISALEAHGIPARSVPNALQGERKAAIRGLVNGRVVMIRDDYSGSITGVDSAPLYAALNAGAVAVVPPYASSSDGYLNVDGDRAGAIVAGAVGANDYIILSNVRGLYRDINDETSLIRSVPTQELERVMDYAQGRMKRKVLGAQEALEAGVRRVIIADGRVDAPLALALQGNGTIFGHALN